MEEGYRILSGYHEDVEYTFESMNLELEDEMTESDIHTIELFGKPYLIAMGKLNLSTDDETLGYFICYLLYQDKVVRKLGIYEINISANEMETINHRAFDFQKEKLLLFDEYYEDVNKLRPYMYNKQEEEGSKKTMVKLKQSNIEFEENKEKHQQFIAELQTRMDKYKPEKTQKNIEQYYEYIKNIYNLLEERKIKKQIQDRLGRTAKHDYFKVTKQEGGIIIDFEKSNLFDNMMNPHIKLGYFELIILEILANVKILLIEDEELNFSFFEYSKKALFDKIDTVKLYSKFDPTDVIFIHKTINQDDMPELNLLLYKDKLINSFENLDTKLAELIIEKLNENKQDAEHPHRLINLKQMLQHKHPANEEKADIETGVENLNEIEEPPEEPPEESGYDDEVTSPIKLNNQSQNRLKL